MGAEKNLEIKLLEKDKIIELFDIFLANNPEPKSELSAPNPYTLLVSVVLSAQATDKSVNKATEPLYKIADTPYKMLELGEAKLIEYIKSIGLYRSKARHVIELSRMLVQDFNGQLPCTRDELMK